MSKTHEREDETNKKYWQNIHVTIYSITERKIVVKSYIALRSFVFLFNSLIFYQFDIYHYYHSCLASEFLPDLIGEYKEFFTELFHSVFSYFVVPFLRLEEL